MGWTEWQRVTGEGMDFTDIIYEKKFHTELEGGVARVLVNRPHRLNAFTAHTMDEMFRAFYDASHDPMIGVVVLSGVGDHFGVGGDVEWEQWGLREQFYWRYAPNRLVRMCRKPVIAMVKGYCIGGSNHLAYCCDFTIAADNAIFGQNGPRVASPADGYIMPYLVRVVGAKRAREMWMLCRRYDASQALAMGLVNRVVPLERLEEEVDRWCEELLSLSPAVWRCLRPPSTGSWTPCLSWAPSSTGSTTTSSSEGRRGKAPKPSWRRGGPSSGVSGGQRWRHGDGPCKGPKRAMGRAVCLACRWVSTSSSSSIGSCGSGSVCPSWRSWGSIPCGRATICTSPVMGPSSMPSRCWLPWRLSPDGSSWGRASSSYP